MKGEISTGMLERSLRYALKLSETLAELKRMATRDALTGLLNRREFDRLLAEETERSKRFGRSFSLVLLDLDKFKLVNDLHGHQAGDAVLIETARRLLPHMRRVDRLARFGGEEIAVLLVELDQREAALVAQRLVESVRGASLRSGRLRRAFGGDGQCRGGGNAGERQHCEDARGEGGQSTVRGQT
ncbi:MAG: GGDEF domain-containing protein [Candidatus Synoicihabitans palmerolidicus]|nr:GGDEF domain-containing protein [Candidatus Synoicihabitans palmerolidicus]